MPIYVYRCPKGHEQEKWKTVAQMETEGEFCLCGEIMYVAIQPTMLAPMFEPYKCPITDIPITSMDQHRENLKKHGCSVLEPGQVDDVRRNQKQADAQLDKSVEHTVEEFVDKLSGDKRSELANEIASGVDVQHIRKTL